jgi:predicted RND superfamily exporter protein
MSWWGYILAAIGIGCILLFTITPIVSLIITICEFFKKDVREKRLKRLNKWAEEMKPNKTQRNFLIVLFWLVFIFIFGPFYFMGY